MTNLKLSIDGQEQNIRPLKFNFAENHYIQGYMSLFAATGKQFRDDGIDIKREEYAQGYAITAFDLTSDMSADDGYFSLVKNGSVRVEMNFAQALPNTVNLISMAEFENLIEIDKNGNVIFDYST